MKPVIHSGATRYFDFRSVEDIILLCFKEGGKIHKVPSNEHRGYDFQFDGAFGEVPLQECCSVGQWSNFYKKQPSSHNRTKAWIQKVMRGLFLTTSNLIGTLQTSLDMPLHCTRMMSILSSRNQENTALQWVHPALWQASLPLWSWKIAAGFCKTEYHL